MLCKGNIPSKSQTGSFLCKFRLVSAAGRSFSVTVIPVIRKTERKQTLVCFETPSSYTALKHGGYPAEEEYRYTDFGLL